MAGSETEGNGCTVGKAQTDQGGTFPKCAPVGADPVYQANTEHNMNWKSDNDTPPTSGFPIKDT